MSVTDHDITDWINSLGVALPPQEDFWRLGDRTALRHKNGTFYRSNYERGMLLYAMIVRYRPRVVMEFGTGRGYGTLCMAWAMADHNIDGKIYTIDVLSPDTQIDWAIDWNDGHPPKNDKLTWNEVWRKSVPESWLKSIEFLTGDSSQVLRKYSDQSVDLAFIDAAHDYDGVRHDYYSLLKHVSPSFGILFDDYAVKSTFGVYELIDLEVSPHFDVHLLQTRQQSIDSDHPDNALYKMAWIQSDSLKQPLSKVYDFDTLNNFLDTYYYQRFPTRLQITMLKIKWFTKIWKLWIQNRMFVSK